MSYSHNKLAFSGERFVPGISGRRIEQDHLQRYIFASQFAKNKDVLDFACGSGYGAPLIIQGQATSYTGKDISDESIDYAIRNYASDKSSFDIGNICDFNEQDNYDLITCFETIEHVTCYHNALKNLYSALKPGGTLLISSPNRPITSPKAIGLNDKPANPFHTQEFTISELIHELNKAGFKISKKSIFGQRQRWLYDNKNILSIIRATKFPDIFAFITSAKVEAVKAKIPRYFILVATK